MIRRSIDLPIYLYIYPSPRYPSIYLSVYLSIYLSIYLPVSARRSTLEVRPEFSDAPHLSSSMSHPKTDFSKDRIAFR